MVKALLIHNPAAGIMGHRRGLTRAIKLLEDHDWDVTWRTTEKPSDISYWARGAVEADYDVVIVAGGDGTIGQAADGLAGSDVALGILPLGSGNVLARELGLSRPGTWNPFPLETAAQMLLDGERRRVDLGLANGRHFYHSSLRISARSQAAAGRGRLVRLCFHDRPDVRGNAYYALH